MIIIDAISDCCCAVFCCRKSRVQHMGRTVSSAPQDNSVQQAALMRTAISKAIGLQGTMFTPPNSVNPDPVVHSPTSTTTSAAVPVQATTPVSVATGSVTPMALPRIQQIQHDAAVATLPRPPTPRPGAEPASPSISVPAGPIATQSQNLGDLAAAAEAEAIQQDPPRIPTPVGRHVDEQDQDWDTCSRTVGLNLDQKGNA